MRGVLGGLSVVALQLVFSMLIRSFAVPVFIALFGGIVGIVSSSKGAGLYWPYSLMQYGMNSNRSEDMLAGNLLPFLLSCAFWLCLLFLLAAWLLNRRDVRS